MIVPPSRAATSVFALSFPGKFAPSPLMLLLETERQAAAMRLSGLLCSRYLAKCLICVSFMGLASCSGGSAALNPVRGKVRYQDAPAAGVLVTLYRAGVDDMKTQPSTGFTDENGVFEIVTGQEEGAPEGEYSVTMIWTQPVGGAGKKKSFTTKEETPTADKLKGKYSDRKNPALPKVTIKKGVNELDPFLLK
jgi:hypothetical protein